MTKEQVIQGYLMNSPKVVAEMLYDTIEKYENRSCDNCKHYGEYEYEICGAEDFTRIVKGCTLILCNFEEGFCCNKWESK